MLNAGGIKDLAFDKDSDSFVAIDDQGCIKRWDLSEYKSTFTGYLSKACVEVFITIAKDR